MNKFLSSSRNEFKSFVDQVCSIPTDRANQIVSPSYATPLQILGRLPPTSREGFPSLPFLIDSAKNYAALVTLWLSKVPKGFPGELPREDPLRLFHEQCELLQKQTDECLAEAEQAERPSGGMQSKWEQLLEERNIAGTSFYDDETSGGNIGTPSAENPPYHGRGYRDSQVHLPRAFSPQNSSAISDDPDDGPPGSASLTWEANRTPFQRYDPQPETRASTASSRNSSQLSLDHVDNSGRMARPAPPARQDSAGRRGILPFGSNSSWRKGKDRDVTPRDEQRGYDFI